MEKKKIILSNGEVTELSQEEVYKKFELLLHKICNNFYMFECNSDGHNELFSIALIAFVKAFNNYDYTKGVTFCSYLGYVTKTGILMEYRLNGIPDEFKLTTEDGKVIKYGNKYSLMTVSETINNSISEEGESNVFDFIPDYGSEKEIDLFLSDEEMKDAFKRVLDTKRNKPFKEAFIDYMNGMKQIQLAEKYNFSQSYLSRKLNVIIKEIKDYYLQSK